MKIWDTRTDINRETSERSDNGPSDQSHLWTDAEIQAMTPARRRRFKRVKGGWRRR